MRALLCRVGLHRVRYLPFGCSLGGAPYVCKLCGKHGVRWSHTRQW